MYKPYIRYFENKNVSTESIAKNHAYTGMAKYKEIEIKRVTFTQRRVYVCVAVIIFCLPNDMKDTSNARACECVILCDCV